MGPTTYEGGVEVSYINMGGCVVEWLEWVEWLDVKTWQVMTRYYYTLMVGRSDSC